MKRWLRLLLLVVGLLVVSLPATAQLGPGVNVFDAANFTQTSISAIQNTISAVEAVLQTANQVLELTPVDDIVLSQGFLNAASQVSAIVEEGFALAYDLESLQEQIANFFDPNNAPATPQALHLRIGSMHEIMHASRVYAARTQTLLNTVTGIMEHIARLVEMIGILTGNMSSNQTIIQLLAVQNHQSAVQTALHASSQRNETLEKLYKAIILEGLIHIEDARWTTWPSGGIN